MSDSTKQAVTLLFFVTGFCLIAVLVGGLCQCSPAMTKADAFGAELVACNQSAKTLQESIDCENRVRAAYGQPLRDAGKE